MRQQHGAQAMRQPVVGDAAYTGGTETLVVLLAWPCSSPDLHAPDLQAAAVGPGHGRRRRRYAINHPPIHRLARQHDKTGTIGEEQGAIIMQAVVGRLKVAVCRMYGACQRRRRRTCWSPAASRASATTPSRASRARRASSSASETSCRYDRLPPLRARLPPCPPSIPHALLIATTCLLE